MQSRAISGSSLILVMITLAACVSIQITGSSATATASQCADTNLQCCQTVESQSSGGGLVTILLSLLGVQNLDSKVLVGITCTPIVPIVGVGASSCNDQPVCCEKNGYNGLIAIGCTPVTL